MKRALKRRGVLAGLTAVGVSAAVVLTACTAPASPRDILRGTPATAGMVWQGGYSIEKAGDGVVNLFDAHGMGTDSPMPASSTSYSEGAGVANETELITGPNGEQIAAFGLSRTDQNFGLSEYLKASQTTYEQRDHAGNRVCGAKIRLTWQPLLAQAILHDEFRRAWDALFYYSVPCAAQAGQPQAKLDLAHAKFLALVIDQQFTPRITFAGPVAFNRGHSVTIVGGPAARYVGGWWQYSQSILAASKMVVGLVKALDQHEWLSLGPAYPGAGLVYSAADADVYTSFKRFFLDRQSDYLVHFRSDPSQPWHMLRRVSDPFINCRQYANNSVAEGPGAVSAGPSLPLGVVVVSGGVGRSQWRVANHLIQVHQALGVGQRGAACVVVRIV